MFIPVVIGTSREGRKSEIVAKYICSAVQKSGYETKLVDPRDFLVKPVTERVGTEMVGESEWQSIAERANGFIFVIPEYNRSFSGEVKLLFDQLYGEYRFKPFGIVGVSSGSVGGARAVEAFSHVVRGAEGIALKGKIMFGPVDELFDENGNITEPKYDEYLASLFKDIEELAKT